MTRTYEKIYEAVKKIPRGKVATYKQVAAIAGNPNWARVVGNALHNNPDPDNIPCYRVVNSKGCTAKAFRFGGEDVQRRKLEEDGIEFDEKGRVIMEKYSIFADC